MGLIIDHVNGVSDDHRLTSLRIVCPELRGDPGQRTAPGSAG